MCLRVKEKGNNFGLPRKRKPEHCDVKQQRPAAASLGRADTARREEENGKPSAEEDAGERSGLHGS